MKNQLINSISGYDQLPSLEARLWQMQEKISLLNLSNSTLINYARQIKQISLHFGKLPENLSDAELNKYLSDLAKDSDSPSRFKHAVYGLRFYFKTIGEIDRQLDLPVIKNDKRLPTVRKMQPFISVNYQNMLLNTAKRPMTSFFYLNNHKGD